MELTMKKHTTFTMDADTKRKLVKLSARATGEEGEPVSMSCMVRRLVEKEADALGVTA